MLTEIISRHPKSEEDLLLARLAFSNQDLDSAIYHANLILQDDPDNWGALKLRQKCWAAMYCADQDVEDCRQLDQIRPSALEHRDLVLKSNFLHHSTPESLFEESRRWNALYAAPLARQFVPHPNPADPNMRLRIGYVSPDFHNHAIMKLLPGVFEKHDRQQFEIFAYSLCTRPDDTADYVRRNVDRFLQVPADRNAIASQVRTDQIDILVDLAGHKQPLEALLAFALKPAPIQITWMGVHATTGLSTMDYFLGDAHMPCEGTEHLFSEKVYRLNHSQYCYRPFGDPGLVQSPCLNNGYITFGCFNNPAKITREMTQVWAVILHLNPTSKLLLKYADLERDVVQRRLSQWFFEDGITPDRLQFEGRSKPVDDLASWNKIDIALDPFPYNGGTTTLDALWMGVPLVALRGRMAVSCCSASFLSALGLPVTTSTEEYVVLASQLAETVATTPGFRKHIRKALLDSPLMHESGLTHALEAAYRDMWRNWCAARTG